MIDIKEAKELYNSIDESLKLNDACRELIEGLSDIIESCIQEGFSSCSITETADNVAVMEYEARNKGFWTRVERVSYGAELKVSGWDTR